jgi:hypothetical protein
VSGRHEVGGAADEAAKLLSAAEEWFRTRSGAVFDADHLATDARECVVCPVCQAVKAARSVHPEAVEHLLDAAASFVAALRVTVSPPTAEPGAARGPGVQRIDIGDGPESDGDRHAT